MSCDGLTGFPTATQMEGLATNLPVVWEEICAIQQAILAASSQCQPGGGQMCTTIGGTTPMTFVNGVLTVSVTNGGTGYYQDYPGVSFIPPVGVIPSVVATGTVTTNGGNILSINVTNGGSGYQPVPATLAVSTLTGTLAVLEPLVNASGQIVGINIVNGGSGYTTSDTIVATRAVLPNPGYVNAIFAITSVSITGQIVGIAIINPGSGYQNSITTMQIVSSLNSALPYPLGGGFIGTLLTDSFGVINTNVLINNTGAGYTVLPPYLVITDPGTGATTSVTLSGTSIASIAVTSPGTQYTQLAAGAVLNPPTYIAPITPAVVAINVANNTFGTNPLLYWQVWSGTATNKAISTQLNTVLSYFVGLGYTITIQTNPATGSTIQWRVCW